MLGFFSELGSFFYRAELVFLTIDRRPSGSSVKFQKYIETKKQKTKRFQAAFLRIRHSLGYT